MGSSASWHGIFYVIVGLFVCGIANPNLGFGSELKQLEFTQKCSIFSTLLIKPTTRIQSHNRNKYYEKYDKSLSELDTMTWGQFFQALKSGTGQISRGGRKGGQQAVNKGARQVSTQAPEVTSKPKLQEKMISDSWDFLVLDVRFLME